MILDGWGEGRHDWTNAIFTQGAPYIDSLREKYPFSHLQACGEAVGLHSLSSISKYLHRLAEEGRVFFDESRPRTISTVDRRDDIETISRRICLEMADGGKLYMDCHLQKPRAAPVSVCFDGILDAKSMRGKIGQVVGCTASCD